MNAPQCLRQSTHVLRGRNIFKLARENTIRHGIQLAVIKDFGDALKVSYGSEPLEKAIGAAIWHSGHQSRH